MNDQSTPFALTVAPPASVNELSATSYEAYRRSMAKAHPDDGEPLPWEALPEAQQRAWTGAAVTAWVIGCQRANQERDEALARQERTAATAVEIVVRSAVREGFLLGREVQAGSMWEGQRDDDGDDGED